MTEIKEVTATFTRPDNTTAYASGDLVANSVTEGSVVPLAFTPSHKIDSMFVRRARVVKSGVSVTNASFRLHLFKSIPTTITNGDNGAFSVSNAAGYLGALDVTLGNVFTDGAHGSALPMSGNEISLAQGNGTIYGLLEARAAYTPLSGEVFTVTLEAHRY